MEMAVTIEKNDLGDDFMRVTCKGTGCNVGWCGDHPFLTLLFLIGRHAQQAINK